MKKFNLIAILASLVLNASAYAQVARTPEEEKFSKASIESYLKAMEKNGSARDQAKVVDKSAETLGKALDRFIDRMDSLDSQTSGASPGEAITSVAKAMTGTIVDLVDGTYATSRVVAADFHIDRLQQQRLTSILPAWSRAGQKCATFIRSTNATYAKILKSVNLDGCSEHRKVSALYAMQTDSLNKFVREKTQAEQMLKANSANSSR